MSITSFFRFSPTSFKYLCGLLANDLEIVSVQGFNMIPGRLILVDKQVTIAIRTLATGLSYLSVGKLFSVGSSTAFDIFQRIVQSIYFVVGTI